MILLYKKFEINNQNYDLCWQQLWKGEEILDFHSELLQKIGSCWSACGFQNASTVFDKKQ